MDDEQRSHDAEPLFRKEALEYHARHRGPGDLMRVGSAWINRLYWLVVALVIIGAFVVSVVEVDGRTLLEILVGKR